MQVPPLKVYNSLSRQKETFEPLNPPFVGIYVCGPTVYNDPHIGNARPAVFFDTLRRYLTYLGYKVRFVRNITDVGHLLGDTNEGEDRISKQARLEQIEPMEIVNHYTQTYHQLIDTLNVIRPSIEPTATGHIIEQIELAQKIISEGYGYVSNGSVYLDVMKYKADYPYGELSGRIVEELQEGTRELDGQEEKKHPADFALWKKASPEHLMRWNSPWGEGFPGWHLECTIMSTKYLGETFDIHGGGMDLMFPHHECEIAQAKASNGGKSPVKYWLHNNMITVDGQKMSKSSGNFVTIGELFSGKHDRLTQPFSPMTVRYFILGAHYRSTLDFSNDGLLGAQKAYKRLMNAKNILGKLAYPASAGELNAKADEEIQGFCTNMVIAMHDDVNTARVIAQLQNIARKINTFYQQPETLAQISADTFALMRDMFLNFTENILGLKEEKNTNVEPFVVGLLELYAEAKAKKEYETVDKIRSYFKSNNLIIKDLKNGVDWAYDEN
ncbi:MAG: cysteine--tRNA ligase [Bacteroidetes bacterium]|nr:MAG: cysteine--tRNA ligase [Bacteroidota bacterium]